MPIRLLCPLGHPLVVPDELAGDPTRCPTCGQWVLVPVAEPDLAATEPAAPPRIPLVQPVERYVAPPERIRLAYGLSAASALLAMATTVPAFAELARPPSPLWVWLAILVWLVQLGYAFGLASLPDWSTVWLGMLLYAVLAALDVQGLAVAMATPATRELPLGLEAYRASLAGWFVARFLGDASLAAAASWISARWRREYLAARAAARKG